MYTTNIIKSVHRQFRKLTKTKGAFPSKDSLGKWTQPVGFTYLPIATVFA